MTSQLALALDVGGSKLASAVVDAAGTAVTRCRVPVPATDDPEVVMAALVACARHVLSEARVEPGAVAGVGVACAGPMDWSRGEVSPLNIPAWRAFPLRERLSQEFSGTDVRIENDAVGIAAGERWMGAGRDVQNFMAVTVSTGVGGGLVLGGRVQYGATRNAGHIGHVVVEPGGPECACGGWGCLEAVASGPRTVARARQRGWAPPFGQEADGAALATAAEAGDAVAVDEIARAGRGLGVAFASAAALLDLSAVLVVGGFSHVGEALWTPLRAAFAEHAGLEFVRSCRIEPGHLGDAAGLIGAAAFILASD